MNFRVINSNPDSLFQHFLPIIAGGLRPSILAGGQESAEGGYLGCMALVFRPGDLNGFLDGGRSLALRILDGV
jgi:hypothetical protein